MTALNILSFLLSFLFPYSLTTHPSTSRGSRCPRTTLKTPSQGKSTRGTVPASGARCRGPARVV